MENILSDESENGDYENSYQERSINGYPLCRGCYKEIFDKYFLRVNETSWHEECLKCNLCSQSLVSEETCFIKKRKIFCKLDYYKNFGIKCSKCNRNIQSSDWVRRAKDYVYHLACFACENCKRQLSTGEEFALQDNKVLCKTHYCEIVEGENGSKEENSKSKNKRVRTTFTEEQLQVLQANFEIDSNPDGQDLERIAQITGLSKRVTQVWFQNSRARQKKYKEKKIEMGGNGGSGGSLSMMDDTSNDEDVWSNSEYKSHHSREQQQQQHHHHHHQQHNQQLQPTMLTNLDGSDFRVTGYTSEATLHEIKHHNHHQHHHHHHQQASKKAKKSRAKFKNSNQNLSWASDDSASSDDEANNENNSMYDSSMEFGHEID